MADDAPARPRLADRKPVKKTTPKPKTAQRTKNRRAGLLAAGIVALALTGCAEPQPRNIADACDMLSQRAHWYEAARDAQQRWNVPMAVLLAFIHQESSFKARAKPPRRKLFGFLPWFGRVASAYGYSQALDETWDEYRKETKNTFARRSNFEDSVDFIGWYNHKSVRELKIKPNNAYALYLAYHEGRSGYRSKSYAAKTWLVKTANKVQRRKATYERQLATCRLRPRPWYRRLFG